MLEIRRFAEADEVEVLDLILPIQQAEFGIAITAADQPDLREIKSFYQSGVGDFWVARVNGRLVGTIALKDIGGGEAALRKMFVSADQRGASPGVARRLLETLLHESARRGVRRIFLGTTDKFIAAQRFYEKNGFREVPRASLPASFPLMTVDTKFYRMDLSPA